MDQGGTVKNLREQAKREAHIYAFYVVMKLAGCILLEDCEGKTW